MPRIISRLSLSQKPWELVSKVDKFGINLKLHSSALTFRKTKRFLFHQTSSQACKKKCPGSSQFLPTSPSRLVVAETKTVGVAPKSTKNPQCDRRKSFSFSHPMGQYKYWRTVRPLFTDFNFKINYWRLYWFELLEIFKGNSRIQTKSAWKLFCIVWNFIWRMDWNGRGSLASTTSPVCNGYGKNPRIRT